MMDITLFTDLNCPFCYATEQRLEALGVSAQVAWRGVDRKSTRLNSSHRT